MKAKIIFECSQCTYSVRGIKTTNPKLKDWYKLDSESPY